MNIITVVGARPNFLKIDTELKQNILHTGQHYDIEMSDVFFKELNLPKPKWHLMCQGFQVGKMIDAIRVVFQKEKPNLVIVFGDTNSSLAGALAAAHLNIPVAHIESGLRSYRRDMPEEINRVLIDHLAKVKLCPNGDSYLNLIKEGIKDDIYIVGDPLWDSLNRVLPCKKKNYRKYILLTLHRNFNADNKNVLQEIFDAINITKEKVIFPCHPRTQKSITQFEIKIPSCVKVTKPVGYKEFLTLISNAKKVLTDSGGVQREAFWMNIPVIILRKETEWQEILHKGGGILAYTKEDIIKAIQNFNGKVNTPPEFGVNKKIREILYKYV